MKPHALRRLLWIGNLGLLAGVAAAGAHLVMDVNPATAATLNKKKPNKLSKPHKALVDDFDTKRNSRSTWQPKPPVTNEEVSAVFINKWTKPRREQEHFPFVGPMPPPIAKKVVVEDKPKVELPTGLITQGEPIMVVFAPPTHVILFEFKSGASQAFGVGDWIREEDNQPERFKMLDLISYDTDGDRKPEHFDLVYGVYKDGKEEKRDKLRWNNPPNPGERPELIKDVKKQGAPGTGVAVAGTTPDGKPTAGTAGAGGTGVKDGTAFKPTDVVVVGEVALSEAKPEVKVYSPTQRAVRLTEKSMAYLNSHKARKLAESVKTQVVQRNGRTIGLQVTGFGKDLSGDVFDVKKGDILVSINGVPVRDRAAVVSLVEGLDRNKLVTVIIDRNGREITYKVDPSDPKNLRRARYFENVRGG